ncbi:MAG: purine-binding chemotaxis protein CheW [Deltaproteobacteria bacterium]|nr:MAG: purine-binding chemotaxis protein CheW [Deltaproteobacteria bacterium]TDJ21437.1 MAG: purine-binding chemotaxis protein CheW [Deltaproteobacteria bacterium]
METSRIAAYSRNHVTLGCFEVAGRVYAIDVSQMREVVRWQPITPLPNAPHLIEGVIDLRGSVVPVVDLARALGFGRVEPGTQTRIAITEVDGLVMGLTVDAAVDVLPIELERLEDPPALATQTGYDVTRAVVRRDDAEPILVLSLEHLLESVYRSALKDGDAGTEVES